MSSDGSSAAALPPVLPEEPFASSSERFGGDESPDHDVLQRRARELLTQRMGATGASISTAYACGVVGVQADQTHYSDGFGLFMPLQQGVAVAARRAEASRVTFAGAERTWSDEAENPPPWVMTVRRVLQDVLVDRQVEVAVVSTVPCVCRDGYLAALTVAITRVVRALDISTAIDLNSVQSLRDDLVPLLAGEIGTAFDQPYSTGYVLAAIAGAEPAFTLVDTATREHLPVETDARTSLRWAVVDPGEHEPLSPAFHRRRKEQAEQALRVLRENGFDGLTAFRDLEHRDLEEAVHVLPDELKSVTRHLVTENGRVQKHVAAMRRSDWQMIGALLLMSHASQREHWESSTAAVNAIVDETESRMHGGLYGACMTGRSGAVLVAGRTNAFGEELRHLVEAVVPTGPPPRILPL